jgi:mannosyl-oligosaccharide alpha-1,2-mannosidase
MDWSLVAEIGSLSLEFTRLAQITGDAKYFDAIQRITNAIEKGQQTTRLPGMWPIIMDPKTLTFDSDTFTFGGSTFYHNSTPFRQIFQTK